ncbi:tolloid-like protein 1 isoform X2 [Ostrea edulis]|uniref:tolloid-like protein 1 isoform X2 n=1 Tax=Ostrea edulis TaxID=37623 RepID=UPI0024AE8F6D|nr:tolloid-like protein 1 isoform X2 [Ostrea edulis]
MNFRVQDLPYLFLVACSIVHVVYLLPTITDLTCPKDGSEILIDGIGFETQSFRFPPTGSAGFPKGWTCNWKFKAEPGLRLLLQLIDVTAVGDDDEINIINSDGSVEDTDTGPFSDDTFEYWVATDDSFTVQLITDKVGSDAERFLINTIAGKDSGTCPGTKTISATDNVQLLTSNNFPDPYESDGVCDVKIIADEGKSVHYQLTFNNVENDSRQKNLGACRDDFKIFDGSMKENKLYDNCALFHPENGGQSSERALRILFAPDGFEQETGFLILFSQKDECAQETEPCDTNAECFNTDGSFRCECKEGFIGDGFQCDQVTTTTTPTTPTTPITPTTPTTPTTTKDPKRLPLILTSLGTAAVASGVGLLVLLFGLSTNG